MAGNTTSPLSIANDGEDYALNLFEWLCKEAGSHIIKRGMLLLRRWPQAAFCQVDPFNGSLYRIQASGCLGSSSYRWKTVYTTDLELKNNFGDYTIVEGENDLFLYNELPPTKVGGFRIRLRGLDSQKAHPCPKEHRCFWPH